MARRNRCDSPGSVHHVTNRGIARRPLAEDRVDVRYLLSRFAREVRRGRIEIHAYCVLTTHFHLLVKSPRGELSEAMRRAQNEYSRAFNRRHKRDGTLIRGRFLSKPIESERYRVNVLRYIDANPVQAGLAEWPWQYPWCSAADFVHGRSSSWLERSWVEELVRSSTSSDLTLSQAYRAAFASRMPEGSSRLVEERLSSLGSGPDALDQLIGAAPLHVQRWMQRKARLADGHGVGIPVCDAASVRRSVRQAQARHGSWVLAPRNRHRSGWMLAEIGLLRDLAGVTLKAVASIMGISSSSAGCQLDIHREWIERDEGYRIRVGELGARALELCHGEGSGRGGETGSNGCDSVGGKSSRNGATRY